MVQQGLFNTQELALRQELQLAPHQILSLEILTAPLLELQARLNQELATNPALERQESSGEQLAGDPIEEMASAPESDPEQAGAEAEKDECIADLMRLDEGWREYLPPSHARPSASADDEERRRYFFDSLTAETTLQDELLEQLRTSDTAAEHLELAELLVGNLDGSGYLRVPLEELLPQVADHGVTLAQLGAALAVVQAFDPPGVGARDLRECLLLQLRRAGRGDSLAGKIVDKYLDDVSRNHIPQVAKALHVSNIEVYDAWKEIQRLRPRPGSDSATSGVQYVMPEVSIERINGEYVVSTSRDYLPRLTLSEQYCLLLEKPDTPEDIKRYIREKINNGKVLIKSLEQRQSTMQRLTEIVVDKQREFFDKGDDFLKPLTMGEVAQIIGVHETTVSRAIANKYVQTPRGLLPLRFFFSGGYQTQAGEQLSSRSVKSKIQALVADEDPDDPLSDQQIVALLKADGLDLARRTVAKYREELNIPSSHLRRSHAH